MTANPDYKPMSDEERAEFWARSAERDRVEKVIHGVIFPALDDEERDLLHMIWDTNTVLAAVVHHFDLVPRVTQ